MALLEAIGSGLAGAVQGAINWIGGRDEQERARKANLEQWQREVDINKPISKVKMLEEAKLNTALAYGGVQNMSGIAHVEPVRPDVRMGDLSAIAQVNNLEAQNSAIVAQTKVSDAQAAKIASEKELVDRQIRQQKWVEEKTGFPAAIGDPSLVGMVAKGAAYGKQSITRPFADPYTNNLYNKMREERKEAIKNER